MYLFFLQHVVVVVIIILTRKSILEVCKLMQITDTQLIPSHNLANTLCISNFKPPIPMSRTEGGYLGTLFCKAAGP